MPRIPTHRKKRDPLDRQVLGALVMAPKPDCVCGEKWAQHVPRDPAERGYCNKPSCPCLAYRAAEVRHG